MTREGSYNKHWSVTKKTKIRNKNSTLDNRNLQKKKREQLGRELVGKETKSHECCKIGNKKKKKTEQK